MTESATDLKSGVIGVLGCRKAKNKRGVWWEVKREGKITGRGLGGFCIDFRYFRVFFVFFSHRFFGVFFCYFWMRF